MLTDNMYERQTTNIIGKKRAIDFLLLKNPYTQCYLIKLDIAKVFVSFIKVN